MAKSFAVRNIIAIEAKVADWQRAARQAYLNTWFTAESYVLLPDAGSDHPLHATAKALGIGVVSQTQGLVRKPCSTESRPRSYAAWLFNEWVWRAIPEGEAFPLNPPPTIDLVWLAGQFPDLSNLQPLSVGGQKIVLTADHCNDGAVVLKLISPRQDDETTNRELLAVTQVNSPRVPRVIERGRLATPIGNCVWFREQRVPGQTVRSLLLSGPFDAASVLTLGLHVLETLTAAESASIVHRDVKPENIIRDPSGDFWLLDFGLARHLSLSSLTATGLPFGKMTLGYAPPEQSRNIKGEIDPRADLFATGVTLYECATGQNPFRQGARDDMEILRRVDAMPLPPLTLAITLARSFSDLVSAMTQKRRDHRPSTVKEAFEWILDIGRAEGVC